MNFRLIFIFILIAACSIDIICAQQDNEADKKYSVTVPNDYQSKGKTYPMIVCYRNQIADTTFQRFANEKQTIILQFDNALDTILQNDYLKKAILTTKYDFNVASDKMYLLGVNENISKTATMQKEMNYYFAATAFITNDQKTFTSWNEKLKQNNSIKLYHFDAIDDNALGAVHELFIQNYLWSIDVGKISEDETSFNITGAKDYKKKWQLSLSYGQWYFDNSAKSNVRSFLEFPNNIGFWNLSFAKFLTEKLSVKVELGILIKKIEPPRPDIFSVIGGATVEIEGGGIFLMPVSVGLDYYFTKQRFRPYVGFGFGIVPSRYKYVEASGNLSNGIYKNEYKFNSNAPFFKLSSGFVYPAGKNSQWGLNFDYLQSKDFTENIGGYKAYNGFKVSVMFSVIF